MGFQQLYYTSCETGLAGFGGYQFNAVTPDTSPVVMREVEGSSIYEPPRWLLADPCPDEPEAYPTAFSYAKSAGTKAVILTHVKFAGNDYSGRPGNYFAHALVTSSPERDLAPLLPVELWGSEVWQDTAIKANTLPELPGPLARGVIDRDGVQRFLEARGTERILPELLTAAWRAMAGDRQVLLSSNDPDENVWWIAAVCYLSGEHLVKELAFTTYSHRPGYSQHHLIGIQAESVPPDAEASFQLFNLDEGETQGGAVHPLAALLADSGVTGSERLWRQAAAFASGSEAGPDDWLGPVATATGLLRGQLSARETQAIADWLSRSAGRIPAQHATIALGVVLKGQVTALADEQVEGLLGIVRRIGTSAQVKQLECLLVERTVARIGRGESAGTPQLGPAGAEAARAAVTDLLGATEPAVVVAALDWAAAYHAVPADTALEGYAHNRLPAYGARPEVIRILRGYPAAKRGFVARLASEPLARVRPILMQLSVEVISERDLAEYPELAEERQLILAENGQVTPQYAFSRIRDIRSAAQRLPQVDAAPLERLWPGGCPPAQLTGLLDVLADQPGPDVRDWFVTQIRAAAKQGSKSPGWQALSGVLAGDAALLQQLPEELAETVQRRASATEARKRGLQRIRRGDLGALADLYAAHDALPKGSERVASATELAEEMLRTDHLSRALQDCPPDVLNEFFRRAEHWLNASNHDARLAERAFIALSRTGLSPEAQRRLLSAFDQVEDWKRHDRNYLEKILKANYPREYEEYKNSQDSHSKPLIPKLPFSKKLFGGDSRGPAEDH